MSFRLTAILLGAVFLAVAGLLLYSELADDPPTDGGLLSGFSAGIKESDVDTLELSRTQPAEEKLVFVRTGANKWELRQPSNAKVDSAAIEAVVKAVWNARPTRHPGLSKNLTTHGLAQPTLLATLKSKGDKSATVNLGDTTGSGLDAVIFATTSERPTVPVALKIADLRPLFLEGKSGSEGPAAPKAKWLTDYRSKRLFGVDSSNPGSDLASIKLTRGKEEIALERTESKGWRFALPANFGEADTAGDPTPRSEFFTGVRPLLNLIVNLQAGSPAEYIENVPPGEWAKYGLAADDPTAIRLELKPKGDAPAEVAYLGKVVEGAMPTRIYARRENDSAVVKVQTDRLPAIVGTLQNPGELRNRDFIAEGRKELIDAIDMTVKGESFRLRRIGSGPTATWKIYGGPEPRDANRAVVQMLIEALAKPRAATAILPAPNPNAYNAPEIQGELKVWFAGQKPRETPAGEVTAPEPEMKGVADASFTIGRVDADGSFFRRAMGADSTEYKIAPDLVAALAKPRLEFVAVQLTGFSPFDAKTLTLTRGADIVELKKTTEAAVADMRWAYVQPAANKDASADTETTVKILSTLGSYQPFKILSDTASPDDLKKWGLDAPRGKVTVGLAGNEKPREFLFGSEADDKTTVYLKLADRPFVMLAPKAMFEELALADFRDKVIFRTDPAKVRTIVLNGWKAPPTNIAKQVTLELNEGKWISNTPDFAVDEAKIKVFLNALRAPRLTEFVKELKAAEMGLGTENGSMQIFLHQEGVPEPVWLDLGKEEPGKPGSIYATSSSVKGTVFKIDGTYFKLFVLDAKALQK